MAKANHYGLILAGGRGTRFWPLSRRNRAKQVLSVVGESTLIEATVERLSPLIPPERLWVLTNSHLRAEIVRQLPQVPKGQILAEPEQRNTAPAFGDGGFPVRSCDRQAPPLSAIRTAGVPRGRAGQDRRAGDCAAPARHGLWVYRSS